jgi:hypothetical protein
MKKLVFLLFLLSTHLISCSKSPGFIDMTTLSDAEIVNRVWFAYVENSERGKKISPEEVKAKIKRKGTIEGSLVHKQKQNREPSYLVEFTYPALNLRRKGYADIYTTTSVFFYTLDNQEKHAYISESLSTYVHNMSKIKPYMKMYDFRDD